MLQKFFPLAYILMCLSLSAAEVENHFTRLSGGEKFPTFQRRKVHPIARLVRKEAPSKGFEASFRCAWDTAFLYLEVTVVDDRLIPADRALSWQNDVIEVYLDYTGKREKQNQFHWFPLLEKSRSPAFFSVADGRDLAAVGVRSETEKTPDGYIARLAIPLDFFLEEGGVRIQDGSVIGFDLCVNNLADPARNLIRHRFWSGDGSNWQSAAANGRMRFTGGKDCIAASGDGYRSSPADRYGLALWPELSLLTGNFRLLATRQSSRCDSYRPFSFGSLVTEADDARKVRSEFAHGALGACSLGEHLENSRFLYHEVFAGDCRLTRITTLLHPSRIFRTDSSFVRLFQNAGETCLPQRLVLPDRRILEMKNLPAKPALRSGYLTVLFGGGKGDLTMPLLLFVSQDPAELRRTETGALELVFGDRREKTIALMPLYGTRLIPPDEIPDDLHSRAEFWYRTLLECPLDLRESFLLNPEKNLARFRWQFEYAPRRDAFPADKPLHLAPQSPFFGDPLPGVKDLDMPLNPAPYRAAAGKRELVFDLPYPDLAQTAGPVADNVMRALREDPIGKECLDLLNGGAFLDMVGRVVEYQRNRKPPVPHVAPYWEWSRIYPFLTPENQARYRELVRNAFRDVVFSQKLRGALYPEQAFTARRRGVYRNLTEPYGCPEPFWNIGQVLAGVFEYAYYTGDYEAVRENWALIRDLAEIIHIGGFAHYRYDGGRTLSAVLEGLIRSADKLGDSQYRSAAIASYASYLATVSSFYRQSDWAVKNHLYSQLGEAPEEFDNAILFITRQALYTRINSGLYSGGYGCGYDSTYVLNPGVLLRAEPEIRTIEREIMPKFRPDWTTLRKWEWPEAVVNRFGVRTLFLKDAPDTVRRNYRELRGQKRITEDVVGSARLACIYLEWLRDTLNGEKSEK